MVASLHNVQCGALAMFSVVHLVDVFPHPVCSRLYVSCCRLLQGTREHVQLLSCELLSSCEPMVERRLPMVQSIACVWPLALTKPKVRACVRACMRVCVFMCNHI